MRMVTCSYDTYNRAVAAVNVLEAARVEHNDISVLTTVTGDTAENTTTPMGAGASIGTALGEGAELLAELGVWAIPSIGPVIEAGWLIATLTGDVGVAAGCPPKSLISVCVDAVDAEAYADRGRLGCTLGTMRADDTMARQIEYILEHGQACTVTGSTSLGRAEHR